MGAASMQHQPDTEAEAQQRTEGPNGKEGDHGAAAFARRHAGQPEQEIGDNAGCKPEQDRANQPADRR